MRGGYLACWQPEARARVLAGDLNLFEVSPENEDEPEPLPVGEEEEDENLVGWKQIVAAAPALAVNAGQAVAAAPAIHNEGAGADAGAGARPVPECSTELKTLLDTLGYVVWQS